MDSLRYIKDILYPPTRGDIKLRCKVAVRHKGSLKERLLNPEECETKSKLHDNKKNDVTSWGSLIRRHFIKDIDVEKVEEIEDDDCYITSPLDKFIGYAVEASGSVYVFGFVMILLVGWIVWGAITGAGSTWQIVMQDGQSIQTYVWNTFLMRRQLDNHEKLLILYGRLKSRSLTHKRLLIKAVGNGSLMDQKTFAAREKQTEYDKMTLIEFKDPNLYEKFTEIISRILGSLPVIFIYWAGIFVWIGCGRIPINEGTTETPEYNRFSNTWQMYINTATAIELLFTTVFLESVRARNNHFILKQTELFNELDSDLEFLLRDFNEDEEMNEVVTIKRCPRDCLQKAISLYAHVIGNGLGLVVSICVFVAWLSIGNLMDWNANWWLVIGSYTGLAGFIDGFALREVFFSITNYEQGKFKDLLSDSQELLDIADIPVELEKPKFKKTISNRISIFINNVCSSKYSVLVSVLIVIGLIIFASILRWSETAQLVVNTPTMIVEGFFFLILIQAHNWAEEERSQILTQLTKSRVLIYGYIKKYHVK